MEVRFFLAGPEITYPVSSIVEHSTDNRKTEERYLYWIPNICAGNSVVVTQLIVDQLSRVRIPFSCPNNTPLAQLVERRPEESGVLGSIPRGCTIFICPGRQIGKVVSLKRRSFLWVQLPPGVPFF